MKSIPYVVYGSRALVGVPVAPMWKPGHTAPMEFFGSWKDLPAAYARARACAHPLYAVFPEMEDALAREPEQFIARVPSTDNIFLAHDAVVSSCASPAQTRFLVSIWEAASVDSLFLLPQYTKTIWESVAEEVRTHDPVVALLSVPLFWQMGPMFYHTCRAQGVPVSVVSPRNVPLARQLIKEVGARYVVTTAPVAREMYALLAAGGMEDQIRHWHIITSDGRIPALALSGEVSYDWHIFPGVPFAYRPASVSWGEDEWCVHGAYVGEVTEHGVCRVTTLDERALPLIRYVLAHPVRVVDASAMRIRRI